MKNVKLPTLVIHEEEDHAIDKYGGIQTAESNQDANLILIQKMGHIPLNHEILKQPENEIIKFITKN